MTYCTTWDPGWRLLETRDDSGNTLKQHVWGVRYVDDLVQIAVNDDPPSPSHERSIGMAAQWLRRAGPTDAGE